MAHEHLIAELRRIAESWQRSTDHHSAAARFAEILGRLHAAGWHGALGEAHEIPDEWLPPDYLARRRAILDANQDRLAALARSFRSASPESPERQHIVVEHERAMTERCRIGHLEHLEPDEEPPDMPESCHAYGRSHRS